MNVIDRLKADVRAKMKAEDKAIRWWCTARNDPNPEIVERLRTGDCGRRVRFGLCPTGLFQSQQAHLLALRGVKVGLPPSEDGQPDWRVYGF
jgi:hypothetical protein